MKKRISIDQLRPGMFIVKTDQSWLKTPFLRKKLLIQAESDVTALRESGVKAVVIDILRGDDAVQSDPQPAPADLSAQVQAVPEVVSEVVPGTVPPEDSATPSQAGQAPAQEESTNAAVEVVFTQEEQSILDTALENMAGDQDLLNETIAVFLAEYPNTLKRIQMATKAGEAETIEGDAASLKNAAGNLGAKDAFNAALQIEQLGKNQKFARIPEALIALTKDLERFHKILLHIRPASHRLRRSADQTELSTSRENNRSTDQTELSAPHENTAMSSCEVLIADAGQTSRTMAGAVPRAIG